MNWDQQNIEPEQPHEPYVPQPFQRNEGRGYAIAGLICGIAALFILPILLGAIGIILGIIGYKKGEKGLGITAIIVSTITMLLGIIALFWLTYHMPRHPILR